MNAQKFLASAPKNITWAGARFMEENHRVCIFQDGKPKSNSMTSDCGVMLEVLVNGHFGFAATADLSTSSLKRTWEMAHALAETGSKNPVIRFNEKVRPNNKGSYHSEAKQGVSSWSYGQINDFLRLASQQLRVSEKIVSTSAHVWLTERKEFLCSTDGREISQDFHFLNSSFQATASNGKETQSRSDSRGLSHQTGLEALQPELLEKICQRTAEQALQLMEAPDCPVETTNLVLAPDQMMLQIHESIGHPLELDRILGDERNYAGWSFVKPEDFGKLQYGSKLMNVTYAPDEAKEFASFAFDESGCAAKRDFLIEEGKLVRGLGALESQFRSGLPGVANARSTSWNRAPIDRMANLNLEPGASSLESIIGSIEKGIWMETNRSWSIDDYRNKFQFGCEFARRIENGKLGAVLKNPNYRGVTVPFWNSLAAVGDRTTYSSHGTPFCGKGEPNQIIRVGHASPVCHFSNIEVFGG